MQAKRGGLNPDWLADVRPGLVAALGESMPDLELVDRDLELGDGRVVDLVGVEGSGRAVALLWVESDDDAAVLAALDARAWFVENRELLDGHFAHPRLDPELPPRDDLPNARRYRVLDRIPVGPFKLKTVYTAALDPISPTEVHGLAWQSAGVHLHTTYRIEPEPGGLLLREHVRVEAPWLLLRFVVGQASASHRTTLFEMKALLEGRVEA